MIIDDDKYKNKSLIRIKEYITVNKVAALSGIDKIVQEEYNNMSLSY